MFRRPPERLKPGDELVTKWLNDLRDIAVRGQIVSFGPGLSGLVTDQGTIIGLATRAADNSFLCVTNGTITACTAFSGSTCTAGSGSVFVCTASGTTITKTTTTLAVMNFSTTTGGIATGTNVWVTLGTVGYFITAVNCGN